MARIVSEDNRAVHYNGCNPGSQSPDAFRRSPIGRLEFPRRDARKDNLFAHRASANYFAAGGGVTTDVILRIMPSDLLRT